MQRLFYNYASLIRQIFYTLLGLCSYFVMQPAYADLKVLSLNLNSEVVTQDSSYKIRDRRFAALVAWIQENQPDVLLVQGGWNYHGNKSVAVPLATAVGYDSIYKVDGGGPVQGYDSNFILAKKKFHMSQEHDVKLPYSPLVIGKMSYAVGARFTLEDGTPFYAYTTHLFGKTDAERSDQFVVIDKAIRDRIIANYEDTSSAKIIVAGDFGSAPATLSFQEVRRLGYYDSFETAHPGVTACTNCSDPLTPEFNPMSSALAKNIREDYIFSHGYSLQTRASTLIFAKPVSGIWMSHHNGVLTTYATNNPPGNPVGTAPNPIYDRTNWGPLTKMVHLNDSDLSCTSIAKCTHNLSDSDVSTERGVTFINDTKNNIRIDFKGSGEVFAANPSILAPGKSGAFFFEPAQRYDFTAKKVGTLKKLVGTVFSNLE